MNEEKRYNRLRKLIKYIHPEVRFQPNLTIYPTPQPSENDHSNLTLISSIVNTPLAIRSMTHSLACRCRLVELQVCITNVPTPDKFQDGGAKC
jgi:hypothetical protein